MKPELTSNRADVTAIAHSNIALVKYWGKRSPSSGQSRLNLPAVGSLSLTLDALSTNTRLRALGYLHADQVFVHGRSASPAFAARVARHLDLLREQSDNRSFFRVDTENNFPTAAGLASSASGFAALTLAAAAALGLNTDARTLSQWARMGSGSAARSLFGGMVLLHKGERDDGGDCYAEPLTDLRDWPLNMIIGITEIGEKSIGSTAGMQRCAETSPYYAAWIDSHAPDLHDARRAIETKDFDALARVTEHSCLKMHAVMAATQPGLLYLRGATLDGMHAVVDLRRQGHEVCFTADAGPQLKVLCSADAVAVVQNTLGRIPGIRQTLVSGVGDAAHLSK